MTTPESSVRGLAPHPPEPDEARRVDANSPSPVVPDHTTRKHHKYGMSKLNAYDACAGYLPTDGTNAAAEDGTRLHEIMDKIVAAVQQGRALRLVTELDRLAAEGTEGISDDDYVWLRACCEGVDKWLDAYPGCVLHREIGVEICRPDGSQLNHGHLDLLIVLPAGTDGVLVDYKFGWIPVPSAESNLQGMGYALGCFNAYPRLLRLGVMFIQPKLSKTTKGGYNREQCFEMYSRIAGVIRRAQEPNPTLRPNPYCDFCQRAGTCAALVTTAQNALAKYDPVPMPAMNVFTGLELSTPQDVARGLYLMDRLDTWMEAAKSTLKHRGLELAKGSPNQRFEVEIAPDQTVVLEARQRKFPRGIEHPALVAEALKDVLTQTQVLACCDLSVTQLEDVFAETYVQQCDKRAQEILITGRARAGICAEEKKAKQILADAKADAKAARSTKKAAKEILASVLSAERLMRSSEGMVDYLKLRLEKTAKALPQP